MSKLNGEDTRTTSLQKQKHEKTKTLPVERKKTMDKMKQSQR
jgi:hypothetical protein